MCVGGGGGGCVGGCDRVLEPFVFVLFFLLFVCFLSILI